MKSMKDLVDATIVSSILKSPDIIDVFIAVDRKDFVPLIY